MKNFKLLLATTAILSMETMAANATQTDLATGTIQGEVTLKVVPTITGTAPLNFGNIKPVWGEGSAVVDAAIDPVSGDITSTQGTVITGHSLGSIAIQDINALTAFSSGHAEVVFGDITLAADNPSGKNGTCSLVIDNIHSSATHDIIGADGTYYFGGRLHNAGRVTFDGPSLHCTGSGTATLIYVEN